jgi:Protein of unknown function DUF115
LSATTEQQGALSLAKLEQVLADLAALGEVMIDAIESGDDARLLASLQMARGLRARLGGGRALAEAEAGSLADVQRVRRLLDAAHVAEAIADRWLARPLPSPGELLASPGGDVLLADSLLPAVWDFDLDLVILVGGDVAPLASALRRLGQQRIVWFDRGGDGGSDPSTDAQYVQDEDELAAVIRGYDLEMPTRLVVTALDPDQAELCAEVRERFFDTRTDVFVQRNTIVAFNRTWLEQGLANVGALCEWPSIAALDGKLAGKPLVVIAPGPSLARNVHRLKQLEGKAVLVAVSHALTALTRAGVTPDFVVAVDPQDLRYHYEGNQLDRVAAVINAATVHPALFQLGDTRYLWTAANGELDLWVGDLVGEQAPVGGGGSVATVAFMLALRWRCDPIAVVGLDLSFPGGKYYVETSCDGDARAVTSADGRSVTVQGWSAGFHRMKQSSTVPARHERVVELPGWHGEPVPSSFMFALFHSWFVDRVRQLGGAVELYNCTEGGASIEGMQHVPLAAFAERIADAEVDTRAAVSQAVTAVEPNRRKRAALARLDELVANLRRCRALARRSARLARSAAASSGCEELARAESDLVRQLGSLRLLSMMAQHEIGDALQDAREVISVEEAATRSARLFELIDQSAGWLVPRVLAARRALSGT